MDRTAVFLIGLVLAFAAGFFVAMSERLQRVLFLLLVGSTMTRVPDVQFSPIGVVVMRGSVWGFRYTLTDLLMLMLLSGIFVGSLTRRGGFRWLPRGSAAIWFLFAAGVLSLRSAVEPLLGLFELHNILLGFLLFVTVANFVRTEGDLRFAVVCLVIAMTLPALVAWKQHWQHLLGRPLMYRARGTTVHPNLLAMYLNMLLPLVLVLGLMVRTFRLRFLLLGLCVLGTAAVLFSVSRGGMAALAFGYGMGLALWILFSRASHKIPKVVLLALFIVPLTLKWAPQVFERGQTRGGQVSAASRDVMEEQALDLWRGSPVTGVGINQYTFIERRAFVHNTYFLYLSEMGLVGVVALIVLFATFFLVALRNVATSPPGSLLRTLNMGLAAGLASLYLQLSAEFAFRTEYVHYLFHIIAGLIAASAYVIREQRRAAALPVPAEPAARRRLEPVAVRV